MSLNRLKASAPALMAFYKVSADSAPYFEPLTHGRLTVTIASPVPERYDLAPSEYAEILGAVSPDLTNGIIIGQGAKGPITWFPRSVPHILICGATASGKSVIGQFLLSQLIASGSNLVLIDPKRVDFAHLRELDAPNLQVVTTIPEQVKAVVDIAVEMKRRLTELERIRLPNVWEMSVPLRPKPIFLFVEEAADLLEIPAKAGRNVDNERSDIRNSLISIARLGRAAGCFIILTTQKPTASSIGSELRSQLRNRLIVRDLDAGGQIMMELDDDAKDLLAAMPKTPGHFIFTEGSSWREGQAPYLTNDQVISALKLNQ